MFTLTLSVTPDAGGIIRTLETDAGCPPSCTQTAPMGATRTLHAEPHATYQLTGWSGDCPADAGDCTLTMDADHTAAASFDRSNVAFVTRGSLTGMFGALSNADGFCAAVAADGGWSGNFVAYLATTGMPAHTRLSGSHGWVRPDGVPIVDQPDELRSGLLRATPKLDQRGTVYSIGVMTGVDPDGGVGLTCNDWNGSITMTSNGGNDRIGGSMWASKTTVGPCSNANPIYCFETGRALGLPKTAIPPGGRLAFLSGARFDGATSQATLDAECTAEGGRTMVALRSRPDAGSVTYVRMDAGTWYRPDGLKLYAVLTDLGGSNQLVPLNMLADAGLVTDSVLVAWTGGAPNNYSTSCMGWTADAGFALGTVGFVADESQTWIGTTSFCSQQHPVYCFEP
jgi:hypothetical protein